VDGRWTGGGWEVDGRGRWTGGGREVDGRWTGGGWEVDAASVCGYIMSKQYSAESDGRELAKGPVASFVTSGADAVVGWRRLTLD